MRQRNAASDKPGTGLLPHKKTARGRLVALGKRWTHSAHQAANQKANGKRGAHSLQRLFLHP